MKWFYNLKIAVKLLTSFILVALIAGIVGYFGITNIKTIDTDYINLFNNYALPLDNAGQVGMNFLRERNTLRDILLDTANTDIQKNINTLNDLDKKINSDLSIFEKTIQTDQVRKSFSNAQNELAQYREVRDKIISFKRANQMDQAMALMRGDAKKIAASTDQSVNELFDKKISAAEQLSNEYVVTTNRTVMIMYIIVAVAMIIAVILGIFIARIIGNPIRKMAEAADKLALGDVNVSVESNTKDEIGGLMKSFGRMIANIREQALAAEKIAAGDLTTEVKIKSENDLLSKKLSEMIERNNEVLSNINFASEQVASGARQVSASSQALSQGATEQASSIEELTASIEEVSSQTTLNAQNATEANGLAEKVKQNAIQGNDQMQEMLKAMDDINEGSSNISKIIKVIDEIAFQTNILALNAAVEAARAGQHGKGFAVVAEEVRNLAARSANAAKETTALIEDSIKKVEGGTKIAKETAEGLNNILGGVAKVTALVSDIAVASNEQAAGIAQITQGISQVSQVVQTNSATSEESAAASEELSSQAELLREQVGRFKLKKGNAAYNGLNDINPDVIRMLEKMSDRKKDSSSLDEAFHEAAVSKSKIVLSDNEFGKY